MDKLKEAERKATQMVQDERKARTDKLKEAKSEAEKQIKEYRAQMESEYQKKQSKLTSSTDQSGAELQKATTAEINALSSDFASKKDAVIDGIVSIVTTVKIVAPKAK